MRYNEFYSLRLCEILDFIEVSVDKEREYFENTIKINKMFFGQLCSVIANFSSNKSKHKKYKPQDFFKEKRKRSNIKQSSEEMANILEAFTKAFGGDVKNG